MRYFTAVTLLVIFMIPAFAQGFEGNYKNESDSICFKDKNVIFNISGFGALETRIVGEGTYEQIGNYLLIKTDEYSGEKTIRKTLDGAFADSVSIQVTSLENYPISGVMTELLTSSGKVIMRFVTGDDGKVYFPKNSKQMKKLAKIRVSHLGYNSIVFDYNKTNDYLIKLAKNNVIENQTVVLNLQETEDETLSIILLSEDFNPQKDMMKSLHKLNSQAKNRNKLSKRYKKEYVPVYFRR